LLEQMTETSSQIDELQARQRELARTAKAAGAEVRAISRALGVSPQTVYGWLEE
jgi:transposase-like protein